MTTTAGLLHEGTPLMQRRAAVAMASKDVSPPMLARCAAEALRDEAMLTPKPALADLRGDGAHRDLSVDLLLWSAKTLEPHFQAMAETAWEQPLSLPLRERLGHFGRVAEVAMLEASGGVNTHRGAIWAIGLMVAAAAQGPALEEESVCRRAGRLAALPDRFGEAKATHGSEARRCYGAGGAREEAVCAFPHVLQAGLPALRRARQAGIAEECARLDALLSIMATLDDTCLLHRGGRAALDTAQQGAACVLSMGGSSTLAGLLELGRLHQRLMRLWASPGGSADLLAATLFLDRLSSVERRDQHDGDV